jgi:F-type H+-transporting ATPase subunit epsilon
VPLKLRIVTPTKVAFEGDVQSVSATDASGQFEVLPQHASMLTSTTAGVLSYRDQTGVHQLQVLGGFVEVINDSVTALVDGIEEAAPSE